MPTSCRVLCSSEEHKWEEAACLLQSAHASGDELGRLFDKYGANVRAQLAVSDEISVHVGADRIGVLLCLVEVYQSLSRQAEAIACLEQLLCLAGDDVVVQLSLVEFLMETRPASQDRGRKVVSVTQEIENVSELHAALLLYRGQALRDLGLPTAARDALTAGLRRRKDRRPEILTRFAMNGPWSTWNSNRSNGHAANWRLCMPPIPTTRMWPSDWAWNRSADVADPVL